MITKDKYLKRIESLLGINPNYNDHEGSSATRELYLGGLNLFTSIYGASGAQVEALRQADDRTMQYKGWAVSQRNRQLVHEIKGMLLNLKAEIEEGLLDSIMLQAKGEILADFILLAKYAIDDGNKDVAAVLSCAALEDTLKKHAESKGLEVDDKDMSEVIGALKSKGLIQTAQAKVLQSYVSVRNKAFHAEWQKIDSSEVYSVIGFVQDFIVKRFSGDA